MNPDSLSEQARAEADRRHAETERSLNRAKHVEGRDYFENDGHREGFVEGAEWAVEHLALDREQIRDALHAWEDEDAYDAADAIIAASPLRTVTDAQAEALREAADRVRRDLASEVGGHTSTYSVRRWLRDRAARLGWGDDQ